MKEMVCILRSYTGAAKKVRVLNVTMPCAAIAKILNEMELAEIKPIARQVLRIRKIHHTKDPVAQRESIIRQIMRAARAEKRLSSGRPELGDVVRDEESGERVEITSELVDRVLDLSHRLRQAEYSVQRGLGEISQVLKEFRDSRAYLYFGYPSFARFCDEGQLKVLGQTRSRRWAYNMILIIETIGDTDLTPLNRSSFNVRVGAGVDLPPYPYHDLCDFSGPPVRFLPTD